MSGWVVWALVIVAFLLGHWLGWVSGHTDQAQRDLEWWRERLKQGNGMTLDEVVAPPRR